MNTPTYQKKNPTFFYQNLIIVQRILWSCLNIAPPEAQIHSRMRTQIVDQFIKHKNQLLLIYYYETKYFSF